MKIELYSDGSATTNDKPGGYGWVMTKNGVKVLEGSGHMDKASNNDAELEAAVQGLIEVFKYVSVVCTDPVCVHGFVPTMLHHGEMQACPNIHKGQYSVTLVSDSQLVLGWADGTYRFKQAAKLDQYHKLQALVTRMNVKTRWVRGHAGDEHNERCDKLANEARTGKEKKDKKPRPPKAGNSQIGTKKQNIFCIWHEDVLKVIDLENNVIEDFNREAHGARGSLLSMQSEKMRKPVDVTEEK